MTYISLILIGVWKKIKIKRRSYILSIERTYITIIENNINKRICFR